MRDEAAAPGTESEADGDFAVPSRSAGEQEVRKIDAGDQQDEPDGGKKYEKFGADVGGEVLLYRDEARSPAGRGGIIGGVIASQASVECFEASLGFSNGQSGLEARDGARKHANRAERRRGKWQRVITSGDVRVFFRFQSFSRVVKSGRHDAEDLVEVAIQPNALADGFGIAAKFAVPEAVAENDRVDEAGDFVLLREDPAERGLHTEHGEVVGAGGEDFDAFGAFHAGEVRGDGPDDGDVLKDAGAIAVVPKLRDGHANVLGVGATQIVEHAHELGGMWEGKRAQQDSVNNTERSNIRADAKRQGEDRDQGEAGSLEQHAAGVADVLQERGHFAPLIARCKRSCTVRGIRRGKLFLC